MDASDEEIARLFDGNVLANYWSVRAFLPTMLLRDAGLVVTIAAAAGLIGVARQTDYSASKFAAVADLFGIHATMDGFRGRAGAAPEREVRAAGRR